MDPHPGTTAAAFAHSGSMDVAERETDTRPVVAVTAGLYRNGRRHRGIFRGL